MINTLKILGVIALSIILFFALINIAAAHDKPNEEPKYEEPKETPKNKPEPKQEDSKDIVHEKCSEKVLKHPNRPKYWDNRYKCDYPNQNRKLITNQNYGGKL